jgi:hypothetical protein
MKILEHTTYGTTADVYVEYHGEEEEGHGTEEKSEIGSGEEEKSEASAPDGVIHEVKLIITLNVH